MKHLALILALLICGCTAKPALVKPKPTIINWSTATIPMTSANAWAKEAEKRLGTSNFCLLVCHGVTIDGEWTLVPDAPRKSLRVADVAWTLRNIHWQRPLVVVSCNEGAHLLDTPNTLYGRRIIWSVPNSSTPLWAFRRSDWIGRIEDFTSTERPVRLAGER
jgi:hypothetical protein